MQKSRLSIQDLTFIPLFTALTILGAFLKIPTPWGVPVSLQFFFALCGGMLLGPWRGAAAQLLYLALGLLGLPVFTAGGGFGYVLHPTFGFLLGFVLSAFVSGLLTQRILKKPVPSPLRQKIYLFLIAVSAMLLCHLTGAVYMYLLKSLYLGSPVSFLKILMLASFPFLPTDTLWCAVAALLSSRLSKLRIY